MEPRKCSYRMVYPGVHVNLGEGNVLGSSAYDEGENISLSVAWNPRFQPNTYLGPRVNQKRRVLESGYHRHPTEVFWRFPKVGCTFSGSP